MEEVALARLNPRFGYESECSEGSRVCGEVIQDLVDDIVWDYGDDILRDY